MTATVAQIWRHPIKGHGREAIERATLSAGQTMPWDRRWAVVHAASEVTGATWEPSANFSRGSKAPGLMGVTARSDTDAGTVTLSHPELADITLDPDREGEALISWAAALMPKDRAASAKVVRAASRGMTDSDFASVSIASLASVHALGDEMGREISPQRFRMNFWLDGIPAWEEFNWVNKKLRLGGAEIEVRERTIRCRATTANPKTGRVDADTLTALERGWGHQDLGVYACVTKGGTVALGDAVDLIS